MTELDILIEELTDEYLARVPEDQDRLISRVRKSLNAEDE